MSATASSSAAAGGAIVERRPTRPIGPTRVGVVGRRQHLHLVGQHEVRDVALDDARA